MTEECCLIIFKIIIITDPLEVLSFQFVANICAYVFRMCLADGWKKRESLSRDELLGNADFSDAMMTGSARLITINVVAFGWVLLLLS